MVCFLIHFSQGRTNYNIKEYRNILERGKKKKKEEKEISCFYIEEDIHASYYSSSTKVVTIIISRETITTSLVPQTKLHYYM